MTELTVMIVIMVISTIYIERKQRQIILHSVAYYRHNTQFISDHQFDAWCYELVELMKTEEAKQTKFYDLFIDFDGSTGFHLVQSVSNINYWDNIVIQLERQENTNV